MKNTPQTVKKNNIRRISFIASGIALNVLLAFLMVRFRIPLYLDTPGTVMISVVGGPFAGIVTAMATNIITSAFDGYDLYYAFINALIALCAARFAKRGFFKRPAMIALFILITGVFSGAVGLPIQWAFIGDAQHTLLGETAIGLSVITDIPYTLTFLIISILTAILDKGISTAIALVILRLLPDKLLEDIKSAGWRQRPLSDKEQKSIKEWSRDIRISTGLRMTMTLIASSVLIAVSIAWVGIHMYFDTAKADRTANAYNAARLSADIIDADNVYDYISEGDQAPGYSETADMLRKIKANSIGVEKLYVVTIEDNGMRVVFDQAPEDDPERYATGDIISFSEEVLPYADELKAGEDIGPVTRDSITGWMESVYYPVRNKDGDCVCYVVVDVSLRYVADFMKGFILRSGLILSGFFILVIAYGIWTTGIYNAYPISSIASCVDRFTTGDESQEILDENVKTIRTLDIRTGDEVEKLYQAICRLTLNQAEQMRSIRHLATSTAKMQDGLIITMADMVENRDSDTGAHIQKTSAYVKIIVEGLKRKGYYAEKITPKFMSDVVRSAPLHDVGKINIPDEVLNKPGKLTPEEFEIMKTHTTAGKKILENAIDTVQGGNYLKEARNMAAYHHERWDGKGYPEGLHGEVIPLSARIMAIADVFDALTSPRIYKPAFPLDKALDIITDGSGTQFDPKCVEAFMDSLSEAKVILKKYNENA